MNSHGHHQTQRMEVFDGNDVRAPALRILKFLVS